MKMHFKHNSGLGIGIPKEIPLLEINKSGVVKTGTTLHVLFCFDCLYGSPRNCPKGVFNLCHNV